MWTWSQRKIHLFQRITVKTVWKPLSFKLLYFGFFPTPAIKGLWLIQKLTPGVGCVKWQTPKYGSGWVAKSGARSRAHEEADARRRQCWAKVGDMSSTSWVKRDLFYLLRANRGSGARQSREPLNHGKSHTHAKVSVRKSRSPPNPVGNSTERREEEKTRGSLIPGPSSTRPTVHPPSQTGHKFPLIKCHPREDSPRPGDRPPASRATESPRQKNLRTPEN